MHQPPEPSASHQALTPPLVGRTSERRRCRDSLAAALRGQGRLVLIGGEAGIGKTKLVTALGHEATARGALVLTGHCYDLTATPPYGPWLDLAGRYRSGDDLPPLPAVLVGGGIEEIRSQAALFVEVRAFFVAVAATRPTLIVLEDLHWADPASLELLRHLARQVAASPLLLAVTYREDELTRRHPFYRQLPALIRDTDGLRIDLRRLEVADLRALIESRWQLSAADEDRLVAYLDRHADGNPLFATELLRTLVEEEVLHPVADGWVLGETDHLVMPPLLRQVIDGRVARAGEELREPLAMAAVIGQEVPLDLWLEMTGLDDKALLAIVERAVDAHLLEAGADGTRVRFVHALTREALYESVLPPRRRVWHRQVGEALAARRVADPDGVAYHFQQAGEFRAWEWLVRAGERAQRAYAWLTAVERFAAAAALLDGVPGREQTRGWLLLRCGRLQRYSQPTRGIADLMEAERLAHTAGDRALAAEARYSRAVTRCYADDFRLGLEEMTAGVAALEALPVGESLPRDTTAAWLADALPAREQAHAPDFDPAATHLGSLGVHHRRGTLPWFLAAGGRLAEAEVIGESFVARVADAPPPAELVLSAVGHAHQGLGIVHATLGRVDEARAAFGRAREAYGALDHHAVIAFTLLCELRDVMFPYRTTEIAERRRLAAEAEAALRRAGGAFSAGVSPRRAWMGGLFLEGGWAEIREIVGDGAAHGNYYLRRELTGVLGPLARHQGEPNQAWALIRFLLPQGTATEAGGCVFNDALLCQRLAADLEIDRGYLPAALAWLQANDRWLGWNGSVLGRAANRVAWSRYHRAAGDPDRASEFAAEAIRAASRPDQPLALLAAHRLSGELAGADRPVDAERHLTAALALADACAAPFERALTLLALAEFRAATGRPTEASRLLAEVRDICIPLAARPTLVRANALMVGLASAASAPDVPAGLTQREVEVLRLVAQGLTDAEVARRLSISPRTVGQHLRSIYPKLGVSSRAGATRFAVEHDLA